MSEWQEVEGEWIFEIEDFCVKVNPSGARVSSFKMAGVEVLETKAAQTGSTFWTAPQSDWEWPPISEHDSDEYSMSTFGNELIAFGNRDKKLGISISKHFIVIGKGEMGIRYVINNESELPLRVAPWEITRVPAGGKTWFAMGREEKAWGDLEVTLEDGDATFIHKGQDQKKYFGEALEGWIAHKHENMVLAKYFVNTRFEEAAPGEAPIEIFSAENYVEVEQQGVYTELNVGEMLAWEVKWELSEDN